ncbi:MAG: HAMP domain-containing sensor histidine kinase [Lachnospiraceae bacterium]|nr:HAMP domain-containing sensor histidine kinase [Lachnospiraceae bacterium]
MKLRTRLLVTFLTIIILPLLLIIISFMSIGVHMMKTQEEYGISNPGIMSIYKTVDTCIANANEIYDALLTEVEENEMQFEDKEFLATINDQIGGASSYLIVRKNDEMYYAGNEIAAANIFHKLPEYDVEAETEEQASYYYTDMNKLVKQIDFIFSDGSEGSIFIITRMNSLLSKTFLLDMLIAIAVIMIFTSIMLTKWIERGIFIPITELNIAMKNIARGNLEYTLNTDGKGEVGDLYRNYENMRMQLKENAEEKLEHEKQNRELVSNISHDLKTPITAIKGYVEGIMDGVADTPEKINKYIRTIYNKANDMDRLINELTLYSGIDNNKIPYHFHRLNVSEYFKDCVEEVGLDLESKNIKLDYSNLVDPETVIIADPEQLKRVINNIISNSVKYMDNTQGIIDIRILDEVDSIRIELEDNGKGIAAKDLSNIFERFYRTDASRNSATGGSGIGLSIVKKIIEDHGGYIWATSKEGEGTCMHFVLRKYKDKKEEKEAIN